MAFLTRIKRFLNKTTGGSNPSDYSLDEVTLGQLSDSIERMVTVHNDIYADMVISGGLEANRLGLVNDITKCLAYGKNNRAEQLANTIGHTYTISKDTYVHLDVATSLYTFNEVGNGAAAPALGTNEIAIIKVITDATQITGTTDISNRVLNGKVQTGSINYVVGGGTANAHTATFSPPFTALVDGMQISFRPFATNDNSVVTFKLDALVAKNVQLRGLSGFVSLGIGDIGSGQTLKLTYHSGNDVWILENPATAVTTTAANVFTANQEIRSSSSPLLKIDNSVAGGASALLLNEDASNQFSIRTNESSPGVQDDATQPSWLFELGKGVSDRFQIQRKPAAGAYNLIWNIDPTGKQTLGTVPLARMAVGGPVHFATSNTTNTLLNVGTLSVGDILLVTARAQAIGTVSAPMQLFVNKSSGIAVFVKEPQADTATSATAGVVILSSTGFFRCTVSGTLVLGSNVTGGGTVTVTANEVGVIILAG